MGKIKGIIAQAFCYSLAIFVAIIIGRQFSDWHPLWMVAIADLGATISVFLCSLLFRNSSMYDPYWSVKPMVIAIYFWTIRPEAEAGELRAILCLTLMLLYGLRLTSNFLRDWHGLKEEDWRYKNFQRDFPKLYWLISFSGIHLFPTVLVYLACVPAYYVIVEGQSALSLLDMLAAVIYLGSIVLSFVADEQMRSFRKVSANKGKTMEKGLWKRNRHPNYLGEILGWWALFIFTLSINTSLYWTALGALLISLLFVFISIPLMDKRSLERRPSFKAYMEKTSAIFPKFW